MPRCSMKFSYPLGKSHRVLSKAKRRKVLTLSPMDLWRVCQLMQQTSSGQSLSGSLEAESSLSISEVYEALVRTKAIDRNFALSYLIDTSTSRLAIPPMPATNKKLDRSCDCLRCEQSSQTYHLVLLRRMINSASTAPVCNGTRTRTAPKPIHCGFICSTRSAINFQAKTP